MVKIEPLKREHLLFRVNLLNNSQVNEYLNVDEVFEIKKTQNWFDSRDLEKRFDCVFVWNGEWIGMGGLLNISNVDHNAELYMYMSPSFQGKGLGLKSLIELCKYAFEKLFLFRIYLYTFVGNEKANNLYEKVGFFREGFLRKHVSKGGVLYDQNIYGLLKTDFLY